MRTEEYNHIILPMRSDLKEYALRLTESDDNAEDLVQEVMLRLWDMRHDIKAEDNLKALAITIMRNKFYDQCRREEQHFTTDKVMEVPGERPAGRATGRGKPHQTDSGTASALAAADIPHEGDRRLFCR